LDTEKLQKNVRDWVKELHESVYASAGDAFAHVAVREYFDLDDEEALDEQPQDRLHPRDGRVA
jgi:hypothetical protein